MKTILPPVSITQPSTLKEGITSEGLYYITIQLRKRKITVTEPTYGIERRRAVFVREVLNIPDKEFAGENDKNEFLLEYSALAVVSTGDVPTALQFKQMADIDTNHWYKAARKVAPHFFSWKDEIDALTSPADKKEATKKKGRRRT